ncbi:MAG TPA: hypothetical protein VGZ29_15940 [Terriglobia bacterium]|nr:hypothetical protein [Terriglobia bacterium]
MDSRFGHFGALAVLAAAFALSAPLATAGAANPQAAANATSVPTQIPPRRSSQIHDGFGINSDLPRDPYLPWNRWWWTRMFDAGVKWIRIGQYENSSDQTSWDWIERKRGVLEVPPELDDYVDSLVDNGVEIQVQLLYGNPMYTSPAGRLPDSIVPEPGSFHNSDRSLYSVFWPPTTPGQIDAFTRYVKFMVHHFRGRIHYWALWNEQDIDYWNPQPNPEDYGRLLKAFVPAVHETDPKAKVIYGGQAWPLSRDFFRRALATCQCASGIDVFAYHIYPDYGHNLNPEAVDQGSQAAGGGKLMRQLIRRTPGVRPDVQFWCDEFNSIPTWTDMDDSVQVKYIPRQLVYNWAAGVKTFVWLLAAGTDGNEYDDFGMIHGLRYLPDDFTPRPVYWALAHTNWLFSDTHPDASIRITSPDFEAISRRAGSQLVSYGFRSRTGKAIVAYWLAVRSRPGNRFPKYEANISLEGSGIRRPVLIDVDSGNVTTLAWKNEAKGEVGPLPVRDSVMAIADADYFDWTTLPEAPGSLSVAVSDGSPHLAWEVHGGGPTGIVIERRLDTGGMTAGEAERSNAWKSIANLPAGASSYSDSSLPAGAQASYRVRAVNANGQSAYSNEVRTKP